MLATQLLEGYTGNDWNVSSNLGNISDARAYIQEACAEFITESAALVQQYYTADIVGQASVLTEGADPQAVMEANKASLWQKFKNLIQTLIKKVKEWLKKVKDWFKKKFSKIKNSKQVEIVEKTIKTMDKDEPIRRLGLSGSSGGSSRPQTGTNTNSNLTSTTSKSSPDMIEVPMVPFDMDAGDDCANRISTIIQNAWGAIAKNADAMNSSVFSGGGSDQWDVDETRKSVEADLGFPVEEISSKIQNAYGVTKEAKPVIITAEIAKYCIDTLKVAEKSVEVALSNAEHLPKTLEKYESDIESMADEYKYADEVVFVIIANANFMVQAGITANNAIASAYSAIVTQCQTVISATSMAVSGAIVVKEGAEYGDPEDASDPPEEEEVTEGLNIDIIKKYLNDVRDKLKVMREAHKLFKQEKYKESKKKYQTAKEGLQKVYKEFQDMAEDKTLTNWTAIPASLVSGLITMFDDVLASPGAFVANVVQPGLGSLSQKNKISPANVIQQQKDTHGDKNGNLTLVMSKINACIDRCDKCIIACDKKMKSVTEGVSIWDQAADYI